MPGINVQCENNQDMAMFLPAVTDCENIHGLDVSGHSRIFHDFSTVWLASGPSPLNISIEPAHTVSSYGNSFFVGSFHAPKYQCLPR